MTIAASMPTVYQLATAERRRVKGCRGVVTAFGPGGPVNSVQSLRSGSAPIHASYMRPHELPLDGRYLPV